MFKSNPNVVLVREKSAQGSCSMIHKNKDFENISQNHQWCFSLSLANTNLCCDSFSSRIHIGGAQGSDDAIYAWETMNWNCGTVGGIAEFVKEILG